MAGVFDGDFVAFEGDFAVFAMVHLFLLKLIIQPYNN